MKSVHVKVILAAFLIGMLVAAGCVAPPADDPASVAAAKAKQAATKIKVTSTTGGTDLLPDATPFAVTATETLAYSRIDEATPIPEDMVCLIYISDFDWKFQQNKTAKNINLVNPPLYVNYSIKKPYNITENKVVNKKTGDKKEITIKQSIYSPYAYLEVVARDKNTGEVYTRDGFGKEFGYTLNRTIQVTKSADLLIEIGGYNVTPNVGIWVKPAGNLNTSLINLSKLECRSQEYVKRMF